MRISLLSLILLIKILDMKRYILTLFISLTVLLVFPQKTEKQNMRDAEKVASRWLQTLNKKGYSDCWNMLSELTQKQASFEEWNAYITELMAEPGKFISRQYYLAEMQKEIEGLPEGHYVTIKYTTEYENTETSEEILLLSLSENEKWQVNSYFIDYHLKGDDGEVPLSKLKPKKNPQK